MPVQSRGKWSGRARQMMSRMKHKFGSATYRYKRATAGRGDMLQGRAQESRGKLRERLARAKIRIIR
jgi:uncharacterized protein YjbJ (UPF0337 family)